ncbi:MAG: HAF repeat-containing protein [Pseudomonadota bacterium]
MQAPVHRFSVFLLALSAGMASSAWAYPEYRVTLMGPANSTATDINNDSVVVGNFPFSPTATHAFLNRGRALVDLGALSGAASMAVAINNRGQVLGQWTSASGEQRGFIYASGAVRDIGTIPGRYSFYTDINDDGYITAYGAVRDSFEGPHSFLRSPAGTFRDLGSLPFDDPITTANALNNRRQITGESGPLVFPDQPLRGFIWARGLMRDLGGFGWEPIGGTAINECGQITGYASVPTGMHDRVAFLYSHGRMTDIDGRPPTVERYSEGRGINVHGHVVGSSNHLAGFVYRGRRMQSLNALIDPALGWDIQSPQAINDAGQIAATAYRRGVQYAVRLDLIRPHALTAPSLPAEHENEPAGQ